LTSFRWSRFEHYEAATAQEIREIPTINAVSLSATRRCAAEADCGSNSLGSHAGASAGFGNICFGVASEDAEDDLIGRHHDDGKHAHTRVGRRGGKRRDLRYGKLELSAPRGGPIPLDEIAR
jgi:hypothetical protein